MRASVIIPVYNAEKYIKRCIESVTHQTYSDIEIVIVNDGSTDNSLKIINSFSDDRIRVINKENGGVSQARNAGIEIISGDVVCFIDADDSIESDFVEKMIIPMKKYKCDIVCCGYNYINEDGNTLGGFPYGVDRLGLAKEGFLSQEEFLEGVLLHNSINASVWNKMFNSSILKGLLFDTSLVIGEDFVFLTRYILRCNTFYVVKDRTYNYFMHSTSAMKTIADSPNFNRSWITEWEAINIFATLYDNRSKLFNQIYNQKKVIIANKILTKARECNYWDEDCKNMRQYLKKYRFKALFNPYIRFKLKLKVLSYL
ncbi:MAG: glycosyltransferase [Lachnospiraceae bacterium]|nr:glycosyltransferase [Lachnospiraceae bacterium]